MRLKLAFASLFVVCAAGAATQAQTQPPPGPDEEFDIAIAEKRITEEGIQRGSVMRLEGDRVNLAVGAWISTGRIDVTLRGVTGHVRFRASLEAVRRRLPALRTTVSETR